VFDDAQLCAERQLKKGMEMNGIMKVSKRYYLRQVAACVLACCMFFNASVVLAVDWSDASVAAGSASQVPGSIPGVYTGIGVGSDRAVINWSGGGIDAVSGETLEFMRRGDQAFAVLNRVINGVQTNFNGRLIGNNGHIIILNTKGVVFGPDALVTARRFTASGIDMLNDDFMNGIYKFEKNGVNPYGNSIGKVELKSGAAITANHIALVGKKIINKGTITSNNPGGFVVMAAGDKVVMSQSGSDVVVEVTINNTANYHGRFIDNGGTSGTGPGTISADEGHVILAAGDIFSSAIEGVESLRAESRTNVKFTGDIEANGDVDIIAGETSPPSKAGSADLKNVSAGGELSVVANHRVRIDGGASSGGDMELISDSDYWRGHDVIVTGSLDADGEMFIEGVNVRLDGDATSGDDMEIIAHGNYNTGSLGDSSYTDGGDVTVGGRLATDAGGDISVEAARHITLNGTPTSADADGSIVLAADQQDQGGDIEVFGTLGAGGSIDLSASDDTIWLHDDVTAEGGDVIIRSDAVAYDDVIIQAYDDIHVGGDDGKNEHQPWTYDDVSLTGLGDLTLQSASSGLGGGNIMIGGDVETAGNLTMVAGKDGGWDQANVKVAGTITTTGPADCGVGPGNLYVKAGDDIELYDDVEAAGSMMLIAYDDVQTFNGATLTTTDGANGDMYIEAGDDDLILTGDTPRRNV